MADKNKSIIESALLDAEKIQEALNANTKEILRSVAREEIDSVLKESLQEDYVEEDVEDETEEVEDDSIEVDADAEVGDTPVDADVEVDVDAEPIGGIEVDDVEDSEEGGDLEGDYESGMDTDVSDMGDEMDMTGASDDEVISVYKKLTGDDEIEVVVDDESGDVTLTVNEPGEFVIKTNDGEEDMDDVAAEPEMDIEVEPEMDIEAAPEMDAEIEIDAAPEMDAEVEDGEIEVDSEEDEDEVMYEIALDEDIVRTATGDIENSMTGDIPTGDIDNVSAPVGDKNDDQWAGDNLEQTFPEDEATKGDGHAEHVMNEDEIAEETVTEEEISEEEVAEGEEAIEEAIPVGSAQAHHKGGHAANIGQPKGAGADNLKESAIKYNKLLTEAKELKGKNDEYKQALKQFRTMLAETVVFNSNLTYVTKLFMEHSTTKDEKQTILKRFDDEVSTLKESKKLYKSIVNDLSSRKPMNESIDEKLNKEVTSSSSKQLNESTAYVDKETSRIMDLMKRVENR
jgi:hypothetical protein